MKFVAGCKRHEQRLQLFACSHEITLFEHFIFVAGLGFQQCVSLCNLSDHSPNVTTPACPPTLPKSLLWTARIPLPLGPTEVQARLVRASVEVVIDSRAAVVVF